MASDCDFLEGCSTFCCDPVKNLIDSEVNSPFIIITVPGPDGNTITVGNESQPQKRNQRQKRNHACVKSLKYGHTAGNGGGGFALEVEITDEAGGAFATFINSMVTSLKPEDNSTCNWINAKWGWIESNCDGIDVVKSWTVHTLLLQSIEFQFINGLMKFNLKGIDMSLLAFQTVIDDAYGADGITISLKDAIKEICRPYNITVEYRRPDEPDKADAWNFMSAAANGGQGDPDAAPSRYLANGQNFIQAIMRWVTPYRTDRDLGITLSFSSKIKPGEPNKLILWEDWIPHCGAINSKCGSIGTYIVNGGNNSPVISFQPNLKWQFGMLSRSGEAISPVKNESSPQESDNDCEVEDDTSPVKLGVKTFNIVTDDAIAVYGTQTALKETKKSEAEHSRANCSFNNVEAELRVQGDPQLADPVFLVGKRVSIVVINPYHIQDVGSFDCGDWLQAETCNSVLSNRSWIVKGTSHEIKEGSYTTTLKVQLPSPGSELSIGDPFGGDSDGFVIDQQTCGTPITVGNQQGTPGNNPAPPATT